MNAITLRAHFDGEQIVLDEPLKLAPNTKLIVTVLPARRREFEKDEDERETWLQMSMKGLVSAYSEHEIEYALDLIKEPNLDYEGR